MPHFLDEKHKVKTAVIHPDVKPIERLFRQLPRNVDLSLMPTSFFEQLNKSVRLEGILYKKTLYVTGPIDKIALLNSPLIDLVRVDTLILSTNINAEKIKEQIILDAYLTLLHTVIFSVDSKYQLGIILDFLNNEIPTGIHTKLLNQYKTTEPDIGKWAHVSRAVVQRKVQRWREHQKLITTYKSFKVPTKAHEH
jgi:hypothetical protein